MLGDCEKLSLIIGHQYARISGVFFILDKVKEDLERAQECRATGGTNVQAFHANCIPLHVRAITCVSPHRICNNVANSDIIFNSTKIRSFSSIDPPPNRRDFLSRNSTISRSPGSRCSYANRSIVSSRCYLFGNLRVANFAQ